MWVAHRERGVFAVETTHTRNPGAAGTGMLGTGIPGRYRNHQAQPVGFRSRQHQGHQRNADLHFLPCAP